MEIKAAVAYLSLGTNLGNRKHNLSVAIKTLAKEAGSITQVSSIYESKAWGYSSANNYYNCCIAITTPLSPHKLLEITQTIEQSMGRIKTAEYADRVIDIDILFYDNLIINETALKIPHPHLEKRGFVLLPLQEIAPDLCHYKHFLTIAQLCSNQQQLGETYRVDGFKTEDIIN
ncbi:MAG: 2-amino-4-hydroxy-6-hydroxymethyldihydropteridine diphosphokinase [Crocinitomicaceae bacterium]|nr:2-amino-4-hydroxy-6-hydroxymethyldihydropteridine diphosphokinase [Crocinitomicaceae bacterium]NGF76932.1 2-amino-4-hydroxy-6-hydroxymethyldihydropteridine diphosphokinase [Fluviicola sp. SGL-29]